MHQALGVKTTKCLSTLLVVSGVLMIVLQIICTAIVETNAIYAAHLAGTGIWCGFFIKLSGIIGGYAASTKTNGLVSFQTFRGWVSPFCFYSEIEFTSSFYPI